MRLVKRDVLNTRKRPATGVPALPGFSYFASISTSTAPTYITYAHARVSYPGKVEHSRGIHGSADDHHVEYVWIAKIIDNFNRLPKDDPAPESLEKAGSSVTNVPFSFRELKRLSGESGEEGLTRETAWR